MKLQFWYHSCLTIDVDAGKITIVVNGFTVCEDLTVNSLRNMTSRLPRSVKGSIILGKTYLAELKIYYQYLWQISNLNLYDNDLTVGDLKIMTKNACNQTGSYLSWDQMIWKYYGSPKDIQVSEQEICNDSEKVSISVPAKVNFDEAKLG